MQISFLEKRHKLKHLFYLCVKYLNQSNVYFGHGTCNASDEVAYLISYSLGIKVKQIHLFYEDRLSKEQRRKIVTLIKKRVSEQIPISYLTKEAWLTGKKFFVDERVIIPRSPIAHLFGKNVIPWIDYKSVSAVLDMCTGSGCLGILAALSFPNAFVDMVDISAKALEVAKININNYQLEHRCKTYLSDLFGSINNNNQYDLIVCNPPYLKSSSISHLPKEYLYEPRISLDGGYNGLNIIEKIISDGHKMMHKNAVIVIEVGNNCKNEIENRFPKLNPIWLSTKAGENQIILLHKQDLINFIS